MYTLLGQNFINMIRSFYPNVKVASGGSEVVVRCFKCGDSKDPKHAHLYISVPQSAEDIPLYNCKKCSEAKPSSPNDCQGLELGEGESYCCYLRQKYHDKYDNKHNIEYCEKNNEEDARKVTEIKEIIN